MEESGRLWLEEEALECSRYKGVVMPSLVVDKVNNLKLKIGLISLVNCKQLIVYLNFTMMAET